MYKALRTRGLDPATKDRAERTAIIFSSIPDDKADIFLAISTAYLDGLIAGQSLKGMGNSTEGR